MKQIRTRFAVSPTGFMHLGGVRTAYFSWLVAQKGGVFILRIEDTDKAREVEGAVDAIKESLKWLGLEWDEGPDGKGEFGPYTQSEKLEVYKKYALQLYEKGLAYADPYTPEQVQEFREQANSTKTPFLYRNHRPENPPEWDGTMPLRLKITDVKQSQWHDIVRGDLSAGPEVLDDIVLIKSDGYPTYNFAHIVDDYDMKITHVLRGEEFIASMPNYIAIYEAFGWEPPIYATLPPVLNKNGGKKLSKRDGAEPVLWYKEQGYLVEAVLNFLASLGWNDGTEKEIWQPKEIVEAFSLERVQKSGAKFDDERLNYLNGVHIRNKSLEDLFELAKPFFPENSSQKDDEYNRSVLSLIHERLKRLNEIPQLTSFFYSRPPVPKEIISKKYQPDEIINYLSKALEQLKESDFSHDDLESRLRTLAEDLDIGAGKLFRLIRMSATGSEVAPGLFETLNVLGKTETIERLNGTIKSFATS